MRKTVTITIGGSLFHIEEDAYRDLEQYLQSIRDHFATYPDHEEIVSDIESRIAEDFTEALKKSKRAAISESDVSELIKRMGTVEDFAAFDADRAPQGKTDGDAHGAHTVLSKRLYRDTVNQMIAGVASGIANFFGINPTIVRLLFFASVFFGGAGILVYIVLWIVLPEAKTPSERAEMAGSPLTLKRIEATIREKIPEANKRMNDGTLKRIIQFPFVVLRQVIAFIGKVLGFLLPLVGRVIGFFIVIAAIGGLLTLTFWFLMLMSASWEQYMDVPVRELVGDAAYYIALISGYIVAFIPGALLVGAGISLLQRKNAFRFATVMTLIGVWMVALLTGAVTVAQKAPRLQTQIEQYVQDSLTTKTMALEEFESLNVRHGYDVNVKQGTGYTLKISGPEAAIDALQAHVKDGTLIIEGKNTTRFCIICMGHDTTIDMTVPSAIKNVSVEAGVSLTMHGIDITGEKISAFAGSEILIDDTEVSDVLAIEVHAGSDVTLRPNNTIQTLVVSAMAGSRVELRGNADKLTAEIVTGSRLEGSAFKVREAHIKAYAGGTAKLHVIEKLSGEAYAGGEIRYTGSPDVSGMETNVSGDFVPEMPEMPEAPDSFEAPEEPVMQER